MVPHAGLACLPWDAHSPTARVVALPVVPSLQASLAAWAYMWGHEPPHIDLLGLTLRSKVQVCSAPPPCFGAVVWLSPSADSTTFCCLVIQLSYAQYISQVVPKRLRYPINHRQEHDEWSHCQECFPSKLRVASTRAFWMQSGYSAEEFQTGPRRVRTYLSCLAWWPGCAGSQSPAATSSSSLPLDTPCAGPWRPPRSLPAAQIPRVPSPSCRGC